MKSMNQTNGSLNVETYANPSLILNKSQLQITNSSSSKVGFIYYGIRLEPIEANFGKTRYLKITVSYQKESIEDISSTILVTIITLSVFMVIAIGSCIYFYRGEKISKRNKVGGVKTPVTLQMVLENENAYDLEDSQICLQIQEELQKEVHLSNIEDIGLMCGSVLNLDQVENLHQSIQIQNQSINEQNQMRRNNRGNSFESDFSDNSSNDSDGYQREIVPDLNNSQLVIAVGSDKKAYMAELPSLTREVLALKFPLVTEKELNKKDWESLDICCICLDDMFNKNNNPFLKEEKCKKEGRLDNVNRYSKNVRSNQEKYHVPVRKVLLCGHMFHSLCIIKQLEQEEQCPLCKRYLDLAAVLHFDLRNSEMYKTVSAKRTEVIYQNQKKISEMLNEKEFEEDALNQSVVPYSVREDQPIRQGLISQFRRDSADNNVLSDLPSTSIPISSRNNGQLPKKTTPLNETIILEQPYEENLQSSPVQKRIKIPVNETNDTSNLTFFQSHIVSPNNILNDEEEKSIEIPKYKSKKLTVSQKIANSSQKMLKKVKVISKSIFTPQKEQEKDSANVSSSATKKVRNSRLNSMRPKLNPFHGFNIRGIDREIHSIPMSPISPYELKAAPKLKKKHQSHQQKSFTTMASEGYDNAQRQKKSENEGTEDAHIDHLDNEFQMNSNGSRNLNKELIPESPFIKVQGIDGELFGSISNLPDLANLEPESPFLPNPDFFKNELHQKSPGMKEKQSSLSSERQLQKPTDIIFESVRE